MTVEPEPQLNILYLHSEKWVNVGKKNLFQSVLRLNDLCRKDTDVRLYRNSSNRRVTNIQTNSHIVEVHTKAKRSTRESCGPF